MRFMGGDYDAAVGHSLPVSNAGREAPSFSFLHVVVVVAYDCLRV